MAPTEKHLATLAAFHKWTKSLFGKAEPCFSCKHHIHPSGEVEINRGTMRLEFHDNGFIRLVDHSQGMCVVVMYAKESLESILMAGLTWAIRRKFHDTYIA